MVGEGRGFLASHAEDGAEVEAVGVVEPGGSCGFGLVAGGREVLVLGVVPHEGPHEPLHEVQAGPLSVGGVLRRKLSELGYERLREVFPQRRHRLHHLARPVCAKERV